MIELAGDPARRVVGALAELGRRRIGSVLLEGGAGLAGSFAAANEVDELRLFIAPLVLGGGRPLARGPGSGADHGRDPAARRRLGARRGGHAGPRAASGVVMFTGIVAEIGVVQAIGSGPSGAQLGIGTAFAGELRQGDSVCVEGVCLTATKLGRTASTPTS